ncbi:hypothetical protein OE88DRAFT_1729023 [Heliocybe sulcata]|uniref:Cyclin N-terminal domain-containing protein n=1 Tax=Heliocybe sulcata TaxID=5364 RepID=A0A5C3MN77_9AGAM|nr:hypothetical protein OE88DRAFT_1729023 [Heliocybe sulcata]
MPLRRPGTNTVVPSRTLRNLSPARHSRRRHSSSIKLSVLRHSTLPPTTMISSIHPASLVPSSTHSNELLSLLELHPAATPLINYLVALIKDTVTFALNRELSATSGIQTFPTFVKQVIHRASLTTPVVLSSMVYISRAKKYLSIAHEEFALERVFLGAVVVASKYLNDSCLKNHHWSTITQSFGTKDIGRIEREWCAVLDYEFGVSEKDLLAFYPVLSLHCPPLPEPVVAPLPSPARSHRASASTSPYEYGTFDILPSDVHSPSSSSDGEHGLDTPDTSPFSPSHSRHPSSLDFPQDVEMHSPTFEAMIEHERRGRPASSTKSAIDHRTANHSPVRKNKFRLIHAAPHRPSASNHSMGSILKAFPLPIPSAGGAVRKMRPCIGRGTSVRVS